MRGNSALPLAVGVSVGLHVLFFAGSTLVKVPVVSNQVSRVKRFFHIKTVDRTEKDREILQSQRLAKVEKLKFESPQKGPRMDSQRPTVEAILPKTDFDIPLDAAFEPVAFQQQAELPDVDQTVLDESFFKAKEQRDVRDDLVIVGLGDEDVDLLLPPALAQSVQEGVIEEFVEKMPGFTPQYSDSDPDVLAAYSGSEAGIPGVKGEGESSVIERKLNKGDLEGFLTSNVLTYEDSQDGMKYFQINVKLKPDVATMESTSKEIVFLLDCSSSIREDRFKEFLQGITYCLKNLKKDDVFNIGAFKKRIDWFRPESVHPSDTNVSAAIAFLEQLQVKQKTDAYNALFNSLHRKQTLQPSYIVFFSDGRPTHGHTNSTEILYQITRLNNGKRPIFVVSGGLGVNRYFLDFISYKNRGWTEYSSRAHQIEKKTAELYEKIKSPILQNLRYFVSGISDETIFPRALPDFFRNVEFTLYGQYNDEEEFSLQLLGNQKGQPKEFIMASSLKDAPPGSEEIAKRWAFNKIYHLISLLTDEPKNQELLKEINRLSKKYNIDTPYGDNLGD